MLPRLSGLELRSVEADKNHRLPASNGNRLSRSIDCPQFTGWQPIGSENHTQKSLSESHGKYNAFKQT